ncbi:MAG: MFS transporter [Gammaproteobacteria bacterium]|nr:MFS transporter [Gammaproteobacteria bacterium]
MKTIRALIDRSIDLRAGELPALIISFSYFFSLLCAYYIIRPLRDEMGILGGIKNLPWVFTGTFLVILAMVPVYGWVSSRYPRRQFLPLVYSFFILNLLTFYALFHFQISPAHVAQSFFIWVSVFNLFVVSVFWSFMNDIYDKEQAKRLFGSIAAGGTLGALAGPILTTWLAQPVGTHNMLLISAVLLLIPIACIKKLTHWFKQQPQSQLDDSYQNPIGGHWLAGFTLVIRSPYLMGIGLLILLFSTLSTFLYFQQASIIQDTFSNSAERTSVFAMIDLAVNSLTILIQIFLTGRIVRALGLAWTLALIPLLLIVGFIMLSVSPVIAVLIVVQVLRRAGNYAIMRPAREMLYVVLKREEKYKAKNFIDTVVYRGGDAVSAWIYDGMRGIGLSLGQIALIAAPIAGIWALVAYRLGIKREQIAAKGKRHE